MTNPIKTELVFDVAAFNLEYVEVCKRREYKGLVRTEDMVKWQFERDKAAHDKIVGELRAEIDRLMSSTDIEVINKVNHNLFKENNELKEKLKKAIK